MATKIQFEKNEQGMVFRCVDSARYLMAWLFGLPITIVYFYMVTVIGLAGVAGMYDAIMLMGIIFLYPLLIVVTNMVQVPLINPQWLYTSVKRLWVDNNDNMIFKYGLFPFCFRRKFLRKNIDCLRIVKHKWGRGFGFFQYVFSPAKLFSLVIVLDNGKMYYLAENETQNGVLTDEGAKLAEYLNINFQDQTD